MNVLRYAVRYLLPASGPATNQTNPPKAREIAIQNPDSHSASLSGISLALRWSTKRSRKSSTTTSPTKIAHAQMGNVVLAEAPTYPSSPSPHPALIPVSPTRLAARELPVDISCTYPPLSRLRDVCIFGLLALLAAMLRFRKEKVKKLRSFDAPGIRTDLQDGLPPVS